MGSHMDMPTITIVDNGDDWYAVYTDDHLVYLNHSLDFRQVAEALKLEVTSLTASAQINKLGCAPYRLSDVEAD